MKLDKTEKIMLWWYIIAFIVDVASTIYFISKGKADLEGNIIIVLLGWWIGTPLVIIANIAVAFIIIKALQKYRDKLHLRFGIISTISSVLFMRTLLVPLINIQGAHSTINAEVTGHAGSGISGASSPDLLLFWALFMLIILIPMWISQIAYFIFKKNAKVVYDGK